LKPRALARTMGVMPATAIPAATVVVLRDTANGPEVLMVRRHERAGDFAGASVFPGGLVEPADADPALAAIESGFDAEQSRRDLGEDLEAADARSLYVAACRELFEEAGLLLVRDVEPRGFDRLCAVRAALQAGTESWRQALEREGCVLALDRLLPFARWITPEFQPRRWDTRFFVAQAPATQEARCDGTETSEAVWLRPCDALEAYAAGAHQLAPPTFRVLEELCPFSTVAAARAALRAAGPPRPILPVALRGAPVLTMVYPGDRDYPDAEDRGLNRLRLVDGRWKSERSAG
jgi:8-oxo-dGTP pyrophosphatase MutT (NUDIX family)